MNRLRKTILTKQLLLYGIGFAMMLYLLKWLELRFLIMTHSFEIYAGAIALIFTIVGLWLAGKVTAPKTIIVETKIPANDFSFDESECRRLNITKRELEVLSLMSQGHSNSEIARQLFVSESTVKSHAARIFEKLDVKRRTQAIDKAKKLSLIP